MNRSPRSPSLSTTLDFVWTGLPGAELDAETARLLATHRPGGIVLFRRNCESAEQLAALMSDLRRVLPEAIVAIDSEGGRVDRLRDVVAPAPPASLLAASSPRLSLAAGRAVGLALAAFDIDLDLAPVVDLDRGQVGNALDGRTFGTSPESIVPRARAFLSGLRDAGVGGCLKHFPGLGGAGEDTHHTGSVVSLDATELIEDFLPFAALAPAAGAVMVSHAIYPALDPQERPATVSPPIFALLRERLGDEVAALSDDLEMNALAPCGDLADRAAACFAAGCDAVLLCKSIEQLPAIETRILASDLAERRRESSHRLIRLRQGLHTLRRIAESTGALAGHSFGERYVRAQEALAALAEADREDGLT